MDNYQKIVPDEKIMQGIKTDVKVIGASEEKKKSPFPGKLIGLSLALIAFVAVFLVADRYGWWPDLLKHKQDVINRTSSFELIKFTSVDDFKDYLKSSDQLSSGISLGPGMTVEGEIGRSESLVAPVVPGELKMTLEDEGVQRVSETNVQVVNVDEPDIIKTDGKTIFYSPESRYLIPRVMTEELSVGSTDSSTSLYPPTISRQIKLVNALPAAELKNVGTIDKTGSLFVKDKLLVVIGNDGLIGYDVSSPSTPARSWEITLDDNVNILTSRLIGGKIYLYTQTLVDVNTPCPIPLGTLGGREISLVCGDIYHPVETIPFDSTFSVWEVNSADGEVTNKVSFVGAVNLSIVYSTGENAYVTYTRYSNVFKLMADFFRTDGKVLVSEEFIADLDRIDSLDISLQAKLTEFEVVLREYLTGLTSDDVLKFQTELTNGLTTYSQDHIRELEKTAIVKVNLNSMAVSGVGETPGRPLNQFSMDEFEDYLRVATTVGDGSFLGATESLNDVYVLDKDMKVVGSVTGLAQDERVYAVRFMADRGYIVTFKQIDPFFVLDLTSPTSPQVKGELKIPGYSSYLHRLKENLILGVGMDEGKVKLSLFDVSDASSPKEIDKYQLDEYWTEVNSNHHAFLQDTKHQIFFIPAGKGGYVFSYEDGELDLAKAVSETGVKRALYINDYFYVVSDNGIDVYDENNWEKLNSLAF